MRRRDVIALLGGAASGALTAPQCVDAQPVGKVHRIAIILHSSAVSSIEGPEPTHPQAKAFFQEMRALGYVEGKNLIIERRSADGKLDRVGAIVAELIDRRVDVIFTTTAMVSMGAKRVTNTVPIVAFSLDPVTDGLAASLARPGGNVTGFASTAALETFGVWVQLLKEAIPEATRAVVLTTSYGPERPGLKHILTAAQRFGVSMTVVVQDSNDYADAFATIVKARPHALIEGGHSEHFANRKLIVEFLAEHRIPSFHGFREFVVLGGLMSYGVNTVELYRGAARHVDKILKGAKPADIPFEQPRKYELVVNLKTARALGLTLPITIMARADEVIE